MFISSTFVFNRHFPPSLFLSSLSLPQRGGNCVGLSDLHLVDQLCVYMNGGPKSLVAMEMASGISQLVLVSKKISVLLEIRFPLLLILFPGR